MSLPFFPGDFAGAGRAFASLLIIGIGFAPGSPACAQDDSAEDDHESLDREARDLFNAGDTAFADGRFESALEYFERAYALSGRPELLFNIGTAADRLQDEERALSAFRRYLEDAEQIENRNQLVRRIEILESRLASGEGPSGSEERGDSTEGASGPGAAPWVLVIGGGMSLVGGAVFLGLALSDKADVEGVTPEENLAYEPFRDQAERVPVFSTIGWIGLGLGTALIAGGLLWVALGSGEEETDLQLGFGPGSVSLLRAF